MSREGRSKGRARAGPMFIAQSTLHSLAGGRTLFLSVNYGRPETRISESETTREKKSHGVGEREKKGKFITAGCVSPFARSLLGVYLLPAACLRTSSARAKAALL